MIPQLVYKVSQILREDGQERHGAGIDQAAKHPPPPLDKKGGWEKKVRRRKRLGGRPGRGLSGLISQALGTRTMDNTVLRHHTLKVLRLQHLTCLCFGSFVCATRGDKICVNGSG